MKNPALTVYAENAEMLARQWKESFQPGAQYAPVADLFPPPPCRVADIGAGPGREAAWLAGKGYDVTAVEPVEQFRLMAQDMAAGFSWLSDQLPHLEKLQREDLFDLLLLSGVWHHVAPADRDTAMRALAAVLGPDGLIMMSLRHGSADEARGLYAVEADETLQIAEAAGLKQVARRETESTQAGNRHAGVHWTWLVLRPSAGTAMRAGDGADDQVTGLDVNRN